MIEHFSSWRRLYRAVAWVEKLFCLQKNKERGFSPLALADLLKAQKLVILHVQSASFHLESGDSLKIPKSSPIYSLSPFVDQAGVLRVGGRTDRHPIVLPGDHRLSYLITAHYHEISHSRVEWTLCLIREVFWITKGRRLARKVKDDCLICRRLFRKPATQFMAALPPERITPNLPAFHFVG
jgi:hypothetical protein